jgi:hypothetical protein
MRLGLSGKNPDEVSPWKKVWGILNLDIKAIRKFHNNK